jgi:hypothetical protein
MERRTFHKPPLQSGWDLVQADPDLLPVDMTSETGPSPNVPDRFPAGEVVNLDVEHDRR